MGLNKETIKKNWLTKNNLKLVSFNRKEKKKLVNKKSHASTQSIIIHLNLLLLWVFNSLLWPLGSFSVEWSDLMLFLNSDENVIDECRFKNIVLTLDSVWCSYCLGESFWLLTISMLSSDLGRFTSRVVSNEDILNEDK